MLTLKREMPRQPKKETANPSGFAASFKDAEDSSAIVLETAGICIGSWTCILIYRYL